MLQDNDIGHDTSRPSPVVHHTFDRKVISRLTVAQLKEELATRGVNTAGCRRKADFIELMLATTTAATEEHPSVSARITTITYTPQLVYMLNLELYNHPPPPLLEKRDREQRIYHNNIKVFPEVRVFYSVLLSVAVDADLTYI